VGKYIRFFLLLLPLAAAPSFAKALCIDGLISNCPAAVSPQSGDLALTWQLSGNPHTRSMTLKQVLTGALTAPVVGKITAQTSAASGAGVNLGVGVAPTTCVSGDVWTTGGGLFACVNSAAVGPFGTGGNVLPVYANSAALPAVTSANNGQTAFVQNCQNSSEGAGVGTGCIYVVNKNGTWTAQPNPSNLTITVGGQALYPGGSTTNQGNGSKIQLATGSFVVGHALAFDNNGNAIDSGVPPSGGAGGSGTVTASPQNSIPFYSNAGTAAVVSGLTITNNAVLACNGSGVPSLVTTLPTGLTLPSATITSPTITGTISIAAASYTGKQTYAAGSTGSASMNIPAGVAPTSPVNGDIWETTSGVLARVNGATQGPFVGNVVTTAPLTGGATGPTVTVACATCATTTNGGTLTATSPITISAAGLIALGVQPMPIVWIADNTTTVHNDTYFVVEKWPFTNSGTINSVVYHTGGTSTPSFTASVQIAGVNVTGCNALSVTSATDTTATCTAANTITNGQTLGLVISGTTGVPSSAVIQINASRPAS
jgi:hypothetical protein